MWPLNILTDGGRPRRRAALRAAWLLCLAFVARAEGATDAATPSVREKDVRRAEKVLAKLRPLDEAAARGDADALREHAARVYPDLFVAVAGMREGDLKTDLDTAVFLYERVVRTWAAAGAASLGEADCAGERPDTYRPLCLGLRGAAARRLLVSKARLHVRWAEAVVKSFRGQGDAETARALSEMKAARENDLLIAARVLDVLKPLERAVEIPKTYAEYREQGAPSGVGFDSLEGEFADALDASAALLASLPRGPAFYRLSNARRGYGDGLFWRRKVHQSQRPVVSANGFQPDPLRDLRLNADQVGYTAVSNWRAALKHTRLAEQAITSPPRR